MWSWLTTRTRQGLAARVRQLEKDLQEAEVHRLQMQTHLARAHREFTPELLDLYRELVDVVRGSFPAGHDPYAPVIRPEDRDIRLRDILRRIEHAKDQIPGMDSDLMELLDIRSSSKEELEAVHARAKQNLRTKALSPDALSAIRQFEQNEKEATRARISEFIESKLYEVEAGLAGSVIHN